MWRGRLIGALKPSKGGRGATPVCINKAGYFYRSGLLEAWKMEVLIELGYIQKWHRWTRFKH